MQKIIVSRHPNKKGDSITALGAMQAFAAALALAARDLVPEEILSSGKTRTWQAAQVMAAAFKLDTIYAVGINEGFGYDHIFATLFGGDESAAVVNIGAVKRGGTVADALCVSSFARAAREQITDAILTLANNMEHKGQETVLVLSHSCLVEMAVLNPGDTPFNVGESDAILYTIEDGRIVASEFIKAPAMTTPDK